MNLTPLILFLTLALALAACSNRASELSSVAATVRAAEAPPKVAKPIARADPFPGRSAVSIAELFHALEGQVAVAGRSPDVRRDYLRFVSDNQLVDDEALYGDYVRIKLAFEATRAGGLWGLKWQITDQLPQSDRVWTQWRTLAIADDAALPDTTAIAECDELSALFAFVARRIGLSKRSEVGLLWPAPNHTVAVWTLDRGRRGEKRIVVPTSQIFLDSRQSLGTPNFDPWVQKSIFDYKRQDAPPELTLPAPLARRLIWAVAEFGTRSEEQLQYMRNAREQRQ